MAPKNRVLLVGWEGADWNVIHPLLDAGEMPHLASIVNNGVAGELVTLQPQLGPMLWASIATGCRGDKHDVLSFLKPSDSKLVPETLANRRRPALWDITSAAGLRSHVVGWPTYPAEKIAGTFATNAFTQLIDGAAFNNLSRAILPDDKHFDDLRIHPSEFTHRELLPFVPRAAEIDQASDPGLAIIATWFAEWTSLHMVATAILENDSDWNLATITFDAIDRFSHGFMRFHPPRERGMAHAAFEIYRNVVSQVYRYADMQLGRLMELAGSEATVIVYSDHGFRCGSDRPSQSGEGRGNVAWHRPLGILAMRGPAIKHDEWIWGASILDICPTVLTALGVNYTGDIDGHALTQVFAQIPRQEHAIDGIEFSLAEQLSDDENQVLLKQLVRDCFLRPEQLEGEQAASESQEARDFNLAQVYLENRRHEEALAIFESLAARRPQVARYWIQLANCQLTLGQFDACRESLERAAQHNLPANFLLRTRGQLLKEEGDYAAALEQLFLAEQAAPHDRGIHAQIGEVYLAMKNQTEAERAFKKELEHNADSPRAHCGLGEIALDKSETETALEHFLESVTLQPFQPATHCRIGVALLKMGRLEDAERAFQRSLAQNSRQQEPHCWLAELYAKVPGKETAAAEHRRLAGDWHLPK